METFITGFLQGFTLKGLGFILGAGLLGSLISFLIQIIFMIILTLLGRK